MNKRKKIGTVYMLLSFGAALAFSVISAIAHSNVLFAEKITLGIGYRARAALSALSGIIPISFAEIIIISSPALLVMIICIAARRTTASSRIRFLAMIMATASLFYPIYSLTLGIAYHRIPVADNMGLGEADTDAFSLTTVYRELYGKCLELSTSVEYSDSGSSVSGMSLVEISDSINAAYSALACEYPGLGIRCIDEAVKPVMLSSAMTPLGITGIYTFFTGEANVNTHLPDYCLPFTVAHEMAHREGIAREDEANFIAFLVCIRSDNIYVRYSGYMNMAEYVLSAIGRTDREALSAIYSEMDMRILGEMRAYSAFYKEHRIELLEKLSDFFNDTYLKANGTEGTVSYSNVVKLTVRYYCGN